MTNFIKKNLKKIKELAKRGIGGEKIATEAILKKYVLQEEPKKDCKIEPSLIEYNVIEDFKKTLFILTRDQIQHIIRETKQNILHEYFLTNYGDCGYTKIEMEKELGLNSYLSERIALQLSYSKSDCARERAVLFSKTLPTKRIFEMLNEEDDVHILTVCNKALQRRGFQNITTKFL